MRKIVFTLSLFIIAALLLLTAGKFKIGNIAEAPLSKENPLEKYSYENLKKKEFNSSEISVDKMLKQETDFVSRIFYFNVEGKKVSGLINIPVKEGTYPVIVMYRGYVDIENYTTGEGTRRSGEAIASKSFITLAPDFLGYGDSDMPSNDSIEERFETYTTAVTLLSSLKNLNKALGEINKGSIKADTQRVGIWAHSNGGQIALSALEITGKKYPTVLWAPVSKPFPYSILYFTDEFDDHGKALRRLVAGFEQDYDAEKYSYTNYFEWINAPIQIHQGTADESVPQKWSDELVQSLKKLGKDVNYFVYDGEDHNFLKGSWAKAIEISISFYNENFKK